MSRIYAIPWYGSKLKHLGNILPLLPDCGHFVEVFGGSGAVLLNRDPSPVETFNDINRSVINFFRVLRDPSQAAALRDALELTPFSRAEFKDCLEREAVECPVERARRFVVVTCQGFNGQHRGAGWRHNVNPRHSSKGKSSLVSAFQAVSSRIDVVSKRMLDVQLECQDALAIIDTYDHEGTLFYVDPPYVHATRAKTNAYEHEMNEADHEALAESLRGIKGRAAISGYDSPLYESLYKNWERVQLPPRRVYASPERRMEHEVVWINYDREDSSIRSAELEL